MNIIENRKLQLQQQIHKACDTKNRILSQQLATIEIEKTKVCILLHKNACFIFILIFLFIPRLWMNVVMFISY